MYIVMIYSLYQTILIKNNCLVTDHLTRLITYMQTFNDLLFRLL